MKRRICLLCALIVLFMALSGCELNVKPASFDKRTELPEDGVISASVLENLKDENKVAVFCGKSGGVAYEWTVFGSDIGTPIDTNFAIEMLNESDNEIAFKLCTENEFGFAPVLSIYPTKNWNASSAAVYLNAANGLSRLCTASVTGSNGTTLNFSVTCVGKFLIKAESGETDSTPNIDANAGHVDGENMPDQSPAAISPDPYVSIPTDDGGRVISDGKQEGKDQYLTDPVPEGKPMPVEPEDQQIDESKVRTCTITIECTSIFNNLDELDPDKFDVLPKDGIIFPVTVVEFYEGESVFDVLKRVCIENGIHMEASWTPIYNSVYIEGINNLYEFDCGSGSGWMYRVNGWYPNYGCSRYSLEQGDVIEWRYTCDLGADIGGGYAIGSQS